MSWKPLWISVSGSVRSMTGRTPVASIGFSRDTGSPRVQPRMRCWR
ncbi:hypothetical protein [Streptomyces zinciresistens]|nr:hypothetical protein [Streptomyces zinciresistens]